MGLKNYLRRRKIESVRLTHIDVSFLGIEGRWVADRDQQRAAWEMYVELVTRITVQPLRRDDGLLRGALSSLYSLFGETRRVLKAYGPRVATPLAGGRTSFGQLAVGVLNSVLRPTLAKWHPRLQAHESCRPPERSPSAHEREWNDHDALRGELDAVREQLSGYADLLAKAAGITPLH